MAFQPAKHVQSGDVITSADWNSYVIDNHNRVQALTVKAEEALAPQPIGMLGFAALAAAASVAPTPISRRRLLRFWKRDD